VEKLKNLENFRRGWMTDAGCPPCGWATPETDIMPFQRWPVRKAYRRACRRVGHGGLLAGPGEFGGKIPEKSGIPEKFIQKSNFHRYFPLQKLVDE
jgi:hypothetical protein